MARLAAKAKLLYYPTPNEVIDSIAPFLSISFTAKTIRLLDPCAGTGEACARLAQLLEQQQYVRHTHHQTHIETYGIEPHGGRFKLAKACLTDALHASFFQTTLSSGDGPDQGWQCLFLNPPYDRDTEETQHNGAAQRLEVSFLQRATYRLAPCGVLLYIVPHVVLDEAAEFLATWYTNLLCYRFPDPLYEQFKQVVLFAQRHHTAMPLVSVERTVQRIRQWAILGEQLDPLPTHPPQQFLIPDAPDMTLKSFAEGVFDAAATAALLMGSLEEEDEMPQSATSRPLQGIWANETYWHYRLAPCPQENQASMHPLAPLNRAHISVLAVAGIANRAVLRNEQGQSILVKGYARKRVRVQETEDEDHWIRKETDTFETGLWCLDLSETPGQLTRIATTVAPASGQEARLPTKSLSAFLSEYGLPLTEQIEQLNPARYTSEEQLPWRYEALSTLKRQPWNKQREILLAGALALQQPHQALALVAEMATGKTFLSGAIAWMADRYACGGIRSPLGDSSAQHVFPLVVICPPIMARKWRRELEQTIPNCRAVIVKRLSGNVGTKRRSHTVESQEEDEAASSEDLAALRNLVPQLPSHLSAIGCLEAVIAAIRQELATWQQAYEKAITTNRTLWHTYRDAVRRGEKPLPPSFHALPQKPCHVVIMSNSTAKFGMPWQPVYRQKIVRTRDERTGRIRALRDEQGQLVRLPACPDCGRLLRDVQVEKALLKIDEHYATTKKQQETQRAQGMLSLAEEEAATPVQVWLTERALQGSGDKRVKRHCPACGAALWSVAETIARPLAQQDSSRAETRSVVPLPGQEVPILRSTEKRRYPLADYLLHHHKGFFKLLIADELHEGSDGTALNFARQSLAAACGRMVGLTGTLSNGYAGNLFRLYWTINPAVRTRFGYHEVGKWVDAYGRREVVTKTRKERESGDGAHSKRKVGMPTVKEIPGFSPQGLLHVLPCSLFLELAEVAPQLPPYEEIIQLVPLGEPLHTAYSRFERETTANLAQMLARGDMGGLSSWLQGLLIYPNMPWLGWVCRNPKTGTPFGIAPQLPETIVYPKEQMLIDLCKRELAQGRRVLIYTENTGKCDILPRIERLLLTHVQKPSGRTLKVAYLRSTTVSTIEREAWLDRQVKAGCDILICNPRLVKVGLDLLAFPTIVYLSLPLSTSDLRQSSRRSWRPGQTQPVRVFFLVYPTMEARMLRLMARKTKASLMVEGKLPSEGLVSLGDEEGEADGLAAHLARELLAVLPAQTIENTQQIDLPPMVSIAEEDEPSLPVSDEEVMAQLQILFATSPSSIASVITSTTGEEQSNVTPASVQQTEAMVQAERKSAMSKALKAEATTSSVTPTTSKSRLVFGCLEHIQLARPARKRRRARSNSSAQPALLPTATLRADEQAGIGSTSGQAQLPLPMLEVGLLTQGTLWE